MGGRVPTSLGQEDLVDRIYEASVLPELWPSVLDGLCHFSDGDGAMLFTVKESVMRWIGSPGIVSAMEAYIAGGWPARSTRADRLFAARHPGFLGDLDVYTLEEIEREPVFAFLRGQGFGWGAATAIPVPSGDMLVVNVERRYSAGPVQPQTIRELDMLRPHLARSALLSARLEFERARAAVDSLEAVGLPAGVLGANRRLSAANKGFEALIPSTVADRRDRIALTDPAADRILSSSLDQLSRSYDGTAVRSIPIPRRGDVEPIIVHVLPVRRAAHDVFSCASALFVITPVVPAQVPGAEVLQGLFDLTPAEARVARAIGELNTIEEIAAKLRLSRETVRTQVKAVLGKTGTDRQGDLAALLAGKGIAE